MSGYVVAGSYRRLLSRPAALRTFALALAGRLAYGVLPLLLLFTVEAATNSFALATIVLAGFGFSSLVMPLQARALDRLGQARVLPVAASCFSAVVLLAAVLGAHHVASPVSWIAVGVSLGAVAPSLGPSMRAQWRVFAPDRESVTSAYALDGVCEEALYLIGPLLASAVLMTGPAWRGLRVVAAMIMVGAIGLAFSPAGRRVPIDVGGGAVAGPRRNWLGPLHRRGLRPILAMMAVFGFVTASMNTAIAGRAVALGHPEYAGFTEAALAVASIIGVLIWGRVRPKMVWSRNFALLLSVIALGCFGGWASGPFVLMAALVAIAGVAIGPVFVLAFDAADDAVSPDERTEASTWITTFSNVGIAMGAGLSGPMVDHVSSRSPFIAGAV